MSRSILALLMILVPCTTLAESPIEDDFRLFRELFEGEFNNGYQVHLERGDPGDGEVPDGHPWHHHTVRQVAAPQLGDHVYYAQINAEGPSGDVVRQRLHVLEADAEHGVIRQRFFAFSDGELWVDAHRNPSRLQSLDPATLRAYPAGCEILWRREIDQFRGKIPRGACEVVSPRSGNTLIIVAEMLLAQSEMWHREAGSTEDGKPLFDAHAGIPFQLRRTHPFTCQVQLSANGDGSSWEPGEQLVVHDQGGSATVTADDEKPGTYTLRLSQTASEPRHRPDRLELAVHQSESAPPLASTWSSLDATRIALQLSWLQVDCQRTPDPESRRH